MRHRRWMMLGALALVGALLLVACGSDATPTPTPTQAAQATPTQPAGGEEDWQQRWERTVQAAANESLIIMTHPGTTYQLIIQAFQERFPEIDVQHNGIRPSDFSPRLISEQQNGVFAWDVMYASTSNMVHVLQPTGAFQDIRPFLFRPDVVDDSLWYGGGFEFYASNQADHVLVDSIQFTGDVYINRDHISTDVVAGLPDLLKPEVRGKIVVDDCTVPAHALGALVAIAGNQGFDFVERLLREQDVTFQDTVRITTEWVATGRYPIAIGADETQLNDLQRQGVGTNVERLSYEGGNIHTRGVGIFRNAPNPNAAAVFANWILTEEGQRIMTQVSEETSPPGWNSRRIGIPVPDPVTEIDWSDLTAEDIEALKDPAGGGKYVSWTMHSGQQIVEQIRSLCSELR